MYRFAVRLGVSVVAAALLMGVAANADAGAHKKKLNFLERLFGSSQSDNFQPRPRRSLFGNQFWNRNQGDVQIIYGSGDLAPGSPRLKRIPFGANFDPEGEIKQIGMGNLTYVAAKTVPLDGNKFSEPRPFGAGEAAIYDVLSTRDLGVRVSPAIRQAMLDYYRSQGFRPVWIENGKLAPRAGTVLKVLAAAGEEGLPAAAYLPPDLTDFDAAPASDLSALARLDLGITAMALNYAYDSSGGRFDPRRLSLYNDISPEHIDAAKALKVLAWSPFPDAYLRDLQPRHPAYAAMKAELAKLRKQVSSQNIALIAAGNRVKPGQTDERLQAVRQRLADLGVAVEPGKDPLTLDKNLSGALRGFQKSAKLKATGNLDNATVKALNYHGDEHNLRRLVYNMERLRWLPKDLGRRHVFVNQAAFQVRVVDGPSELWRSNVIVGKPMTQTAVFNDEIEMVVFNPSWGVPPSIIANEYLPKLREDPYYLDRIGFKVTTTDGQPLSSGDVDWWAYDQLVPFSIQQPPGAKNALGELKFLFPNSHDIYMHDTPNRELFAEDLRAFSHGCIRVQNPRDFATLLLGWSKAKVDATTDSRKSQTIRLPTKVPIHIAYFTAWPDESGKMLYFNDIYERDESLEKAMSATTIAQR